MSTLAVRAASPKDAPNLDILRAIAVLCVLGDHALQTWGWRTGASFHPYDWIFGRLGVLLFFVHTSLVLMYSLTRLKLEGWTAYKVFMVRRAFRIFPLSTLCILLVLALQVPALPWESFSWLGWKNLTSNVLLTTNLTYSPPVLAPLWSLPIELQMYCVLPVLFWILGEQRRLSTAAALFALALGAAVVQPYISERLTVANCAPCFMGGVFAYAAIRHVRARLFGFVWLPFLLASIAGYVMLAAYFHQYVTGPLQWLYCLFIGASIPLFLDFPSALVNRAAHWIAKYSYGVYLFHCIALWFGFAVLSSFHPALQVIVTLACIVVLSVASYHWLEKPAIDYAARTDWARAGGRRPVLEKREAGADAP